MAQPKSGVSSPGVNAGRNSVGGLCTTDILDVAPHLKAGQKLGVGLKPFY